MRTIIRLAGLGLPVFLSAAPSALAHHVMGGDTPRTAIQGLLSGLSHPVIGLDHLAFVVGIGVIAAGVRQGWLLPAAFLAAGGLGTAAHLAGISVASGEALVTLSVLAMGCAVLVGRGGSAVLLALLCAFGGLIHGYVLAESIVGAEPAPLWAYLVGLALVQFAISLAVREAVRRVAAWRPVLAERAAAAASVAIMAVGVAVQFWPA